MTQHAWSPDRARLLAALRERRPAGLPLTATQQGIWLAECLDPGLSGYHDTATLRVRGPLDTDALGAALGDAQERHEALRARVVAEDGEPRQLFDVRGVDHRLVDLSALPEPTRQARLGRLVEAVADLPFAMETGPLWRSRLVRLAADEHLLVLVIHHVIADGRSHGVFLESLLACYEARVRGGCPLPASANTSPNASAGMCADASSPQGYAVWLTDRVRRERDLVGQGVAEKVAADLEGVPYRLRAPGHDPRPPDRTAVELTVPLTAAEQAAFDAACARYGTTRFMALAGLFAAVLARASGRDGVLMSAPVVGRYDAAAAELLGCLINVVPIDVRVTGRETPRAAIAAGTAAVLTALRHPDLPYREVVRAAGAPAHADDPLTDVAIEEFNAPTRGVSRGPVRIDPLPRGRIRLRHDLTLSVSPDALSLLYPRERWAEGAVQDLAHDLARSVHEVIGGDPPPHRTE